MVCATRGQIRGRTHTRAVGTRFDHGRCGNRNEATACTRGGSTGLQPRCCRMGSSLRTGPSSPGHVGDDPLQIWRSGRTDSGVGHLQSTRLGAPHVPVVLRLRGESSVPRTAVQTSFAVRRPLTARGDVGAWVACGQAVRQRDRSGMGEFPCDDSQVTVDPRSVHVFNKAWRSGGFRFILTLYFILCCIQASLRWLPCLLLI